MRMPDASMLAFPNPFPPLRRLDLRGLFLRLASDRLSRYGQPCYLRPYFALLRTDRCYLPTLFLRIPWY